MTAEAMLSLLEQRTHKDAEYLIQELNSAKDWAFHWMFTQNTNLLLVFDVETTPSTSTTTRDFDLASNVTAGDELYAVKTLWARFSNETNFTPMRHLDSNDPDFLENDIYQTGNTSDQASSHPIFWTSLNFDRARFAPPLPANAEIRIDYYRKPPDFSLDANADLDPNVDMPDPTHHPIVDKATGQVLHAMDDDKWGEYEAQAERKLYQALNVLRDRQFQSPPRTQAYRRRVRRWI